jgi:hypothetical protein
VANLHLPFSLFEFTKIRVRFTKNVIKRGIPKTSQIIE